MNITIYLLALHVCPCWCSVWPYGQWLQREERRWWMAHYALFCFFYLIWLIK